MIRRDSEVMRRRKLRDADDVQTQDLAPSRDVVDRQLLEQRIDPTSLLFVLTYGLTN